MNDLQIKFLQKIGVDPDANLDVIEEAVGDYLTLHCLDENYNPTTEGLICESILDYIGEQ